MKTKNIFRMLLVAAALLLGANNVKADETFRLWTSENGDAGTEMKGWQSYDLGDNYLQSISEGDVVNFYGWVISTEDQRSVGLYNNNNNSIIGEFYAWQTDIFPNGVCSRTVTKDQANMFHATPYIELRGQNVYVTKVEVIHKGSGTQTTTYSITIDNNIQHGTVSVSGGKTTGLAANETVTLTATPASGYELSAWNVKDASNNAITVTNNQFSMPASNVTVSAEFTVVYSAAEKDKHALTFTTDEDYYAANWNSSTNTFSWSPDYQAWGQPEWTFMSAVGINGDLSNWTHLHLHVSDWNNASAKELTVVFKKNDGSSPPNGPTKEFVVSPNASGNIDLNLVGINWGDCDITNIQDLTIYGCARDDESRVASVVITDAYYVTATVSETYTVSVSAGSNGSASVDKPTAAANETVTITTNPNSGYEVDAVTVANVNVIKDANVSNRYTFTMPANNVTVNVTFKAITQTQQDVTVYGSYANNIWTFNFATMAATVSGDTNLSLTSEKTINGVNMYKASWENNAINTKFLLGEPSNENTWKLRPNNYGGTLYLNNSDKKIGFQNLSEGQLIKVNLVVDAKSDGTKSYPTDNNNYNVSLTTNPNGDGTYIFTVSNNGDAYINLGNKTYIKSITIEPAPQQTNPDPVETVEYEDVYIGDTHYATFSSSSAINLSNLSDVKAYIATAIDLEQNKVTLTQVSTTVAAGTGLILISEKNQSARTFSLPKSTATGTSYGNNLLLASYANTNLSQDDSDYTYYVLVERNGVARFAEVYSYDAHPGVGKAYLRTDKVSHASARTRGLSIEINDGTTGINGVKNEQGENVIYNLRGQRVENPTKGLYIINGKKVIIK